MFSCFKSIFFPFILLIILLFECLCNDNNLVKVIVLFRHGARAPLFPYKFHGILDNDEKFWPDGYGNLLRDGKEQLFQLGQNLRKRYEHLIVPHSNAVHLDLKAVTTISERCYQSAGFLIAGLYPPNSEQKWSEGLNWQPVPIIFKSPDRNEIIGNALLCPAYNVDLESVKLDANRSNTDVNYLMNYLSSHITSPTLRDYTDLFFLADYFNTKLSMNFTLPSWIPKKIYSKLNKFYLESFNILTATDRMRRLLPGALIKDIISRIDDVIYNHSSNSKFFLYSGHDSSLHSLGRTIGFNFKSVPYFGSSFIFEIYHSSTNDFRIKLLYNEDYSFKKLKVRTIPGCEELCPVKQFINLIEKFIPVDWEKECNSL